MSLQVEHQDDQPARRHTVKVAARILGTSVRSTYRAIEKGEIQAKRIAGRTIVP